MNELSMKMSRSNPVSRVTHDRIADSGEMYANLMCAPCYGTNFDQSISIEVFSDLILGSGLFPRFHYCHSSSVMRVSPDGCFDDSLFRGEPSSDEDKVSLGYGSAFELCS